MPELFFSQKQTRSFAITIPVRDALGGFTGKTRTFETDDPASLEEWYERNTFKKPKKKKHGQDEDDKPKKRSRRNRRASQTEGSTTTKTE